MDHSGRRDRLAARFDEIGADAFLVTALPNVRYLSGFSGSNAQLVLVPGGGVLLTDGRYAQQSRREVPDLERRIYQGELPPVAAKACADLGVGRVGFEAPGVTHQLFLDLVEAGVELVPTRGEVERLRWAKEPEEVQHLMAAQAIADAAFDAVVLSLRDGTSERDVALALDVEMRRLGAEAVGFDTIVAFGPNAAEPHHHPSDRPLERGDVVKVDFGCVVEGYHSDMTRTVAFGPLSPELRDVYGVIRRAQQAGVEAVRAGTTGGAVDALVRGIITEAGHGERFRHGLGHGVGLEIHEGPALRVGGTDVLPVGAVVTVEPGIYVEGVGGVRIEDMVEVTGSEPRVLARTPKDLIEL